MNTETKIWNIILIPLSIILGIVYYPSWIMMTLWFGIGTVNILRIVLPEGKYKQISLRIFGGILLIIAIINILRLLDLI